MQQRYIYNVPRLFPRHSLVIPRLILFIPFNNSMHPTSNVHLQITYILNVCFTFNILH